MADEEGPDRIIPADNLITWEKDGCVKLRMIPEFPGDRDSMSLITFTKKQCQVFRQHLLYRVIPGLLRYYNIHKGHQKSPCSYFPLVYSIFDQTST